MLDPERSRVARLVRPAWKLLPESVRASGAVRRVRERMMGVHLVRSLAELDRELQRIDSSTYEDEHDIFASFRMEVDRGEIGDPTSAIYRQREIGLYEWISGKRYDPTNDVTHLHLDHATIRPFPYATRSTTGVGDQLMAIGFVIRCLDLPAESKILEFGPGWGNLTIALARMGHDVTAVDIAPDFIELIRRRAEQECCSVKLIEGDFSVDIEGTFDAVVFFESFHHCVDHVGLIKRLPSLVTPGGKVIFAGEPITDGFDVPWGIRLDGESLWAMRRNGWFECGFREEYFLGLLTSEGWSVRKETLDGVPAGTVYVATR